MTPTDPMADLIEVHRTPYLRDDDYNSSSWEIGSSIAPPGRTYLYDVCRVF